MARAGPAGIRRSGRSSRLPSGSPRRAPSQRRRPPTRSHDLRDRRPSPLPPLPARRAGETHPASRGQGIESNFTGWAAGSTTSHSFPRPTTFAAGVSSKNLTHSTSRSKGNEARPLTTGPTPRLKARCKLSDDHCQGTGIEIREVGPRRMTTSTGSAGEIMADETRVAHVVPRLQGVVDCGPKNAAIRYGAET